MDVSLLHIGMHKTASTYMQNIWLYDNNYSLFYKGTIDFINKLREENKRDDLKYNQNIDIKLASSHSSGKKLIVSNEGLYLAYLNEVEFQDKIRQYRDYSSQVMGQLPTENLLIVVREPISWIKSMFNQSIKQGNSNSAQKFVKNQEKLLKNAFDLKFIVNCYERYFDNVMIIPFEILKDNRAEFWNKICKNFGLPMVNYKFKKSNQSFNTKELFLLAKLNQLNNFLYNILNDSIDYKDRQPKEKELLLERYSITKKWIPRRFIEFADEKEIDKVYNLLNISNVPNDFLDFDLSLDLLNIIETKYIKFLENKISKQYINLYEKEVKKYSEG